jgi:arginine N-succinyltransferase
MMVVRTVREGDLEALFALAQQAGAGMTSFKPDRAALARRIERARRTLAGEAALAERGYLFVMEDSVARQVVGVCGLETAVGLEQPFYNYRLATVVHASRELEVWTQMTMLHMSHDLTGYAELCSLFLAPAARAPGHGALLSKARFMFLAQFPERFPARICAELRGHFDAQGESPFWREVGAHFYQIDFNEADYLSAHGKKSFLAELMPRYPVYVELLPAAAQACIAKTHQDTLPARALLEAEGLRFDNHVDIFDAGPVLEAHIDTTRAVRESVLANAEIGPPAVPGPVRYLVSNTSLAEFRVIVVARAPRAGVQHLSAAQAEALGVAAGEPLRTLTLYPKKARERREH